MQRDGASDRSRFVVPAQHCSCASGAGCRRVGIVTKAAMFCLAAGLASAQTASLTVNTGNVLHAIDPRIYGQSLEPADGGLWGEVVWNRSFEETLNWGAWNVNGGVLEAASGNDESRFEFGAETWRDYELTVDVMRPAGRGVLGVGVRKDYIIENFALSLGGTSGLELARTVYLSNASRHQTTVLQTVAGPIANGRWYKVRIRIEGTRLQAWLDGTDRKSTRLNSSHLVISYAVFCLETHTETGCGQEALPMPAPTRNPRGHDLPR